MRISLEEGIQRLIQGEVVAFPTDTVYGVAGLLSDPKAISSIFQLKGRPEKKPLVVMVPSIDQIHPLIQDQSNFQQLAEKYWPGALTIILQANQEAIPKEIRSNLPTVGIRIPNHSIALAVLEKTGPLAVTSANITAHASAKSIEQIEEYFGKDFPVIEGESGSGVESTIVIRDSNQWRVLRQGSIQIDF